MRVIVPGGYYSYDSAGKKIWLDYQYYGTTLENIERVKNLTRNKIIYDCKRSTVLPTVENGCITHSYQGTEADADKIQVTLRTPITNSLTELTPVDGVVTLETDGKVLVLPTSNAAILPSFNQSVLDPNRLTIAESPFGGLKGSGSPDYAPGTLYTPTDGVYLTDVNGQNSTKTLTAGKLVEIGNMTVDTSAHTITEEFIVENTATSNTPTVIDDGSDAAGWVFSWGTNTALESVGGALHATGTGDGNLLLIKKTVSPVLFTNANFITVKIKRSGISSGTLLSFRMTDTGGKRKSWTNIARFTVGTDYTIFVLALNSPAGSVGAMPTEDAGFVLANLSYVEVGLVTTTGQTSEFYVDSITADTAKSAYLELQIPDNLADSSITLQAWDGSAYQTTGVYKLDSSYEAVSTTTENWKFPDGTKFDDCYGSGNGRALFPKGVSAETKAGSSGSITYSANKGTSKRIGFRVDLPPSDGGRTNFNKCRMKAILSYTDTVGNIVPDLSGNNNTGTIVGGVTKLNDGGLKFDGSTGYVYKTNTDNLSISDSFTVSAWIKLPDTPNYAPIIVKGIVDTKFDNYLLLVDNIGYKVRFYVGKSDNSLSATCSVSYTKNVWLHFVGTFNSTNIILYSNSVATEPVNTGFTATTNTGQVQIGYKWGSSWYNGQIGEVRIYNRTLSQNEVTALYNNQPVDSTGLVLHYNPTVQNMGSTTHQFADSTNASYGLQNLSKPWVALYDPANSLIDFYLFTHRPQNLSFKRDETGTIYSLSLYPGAGSVYHGQIPFADLTLDTNSDSVPDCLEAAVNGSVTKFLQNYSMVI